MLKRKLLCDSSADLLTFPGVDYASVPLQIVTAEKHYVDDAALNVDEMIDELKNYKGRSGTSCPNIGDWLAAFGEADEVFAVTITGALSGCHNAAVCAAKQYEEEHPGRRVLVVDSLSTGPEIVLIAEKLRELMASPRTFEEIKGEIAAFQTRSKLLFILSSVQNLARNGRANKVEALAVGLLGIRIVGEASAAGELAMLAKSRGQGGALRKTVQLMQEKGWDGGRVVISHCRCREAAETLAAQLKSVMPGADILIHPTRALCSFYAEEGGMLIGYMSRA